MQETENKPMPPAGPLSCDEMNRRRFFARLSIGMGAICTAILAVPLVGFVCAPFFRKIPGGWIDAGKVDDFEIGKTVQVPYPDPSPLPWAGITAKSAAWLRRDGKETFTAYSIHCTHMGCPVRWLPNAGLFMCPCHGGVFYADGTVGAGPPPKPLVRYPVEVMDGQVKIKVVPLPITTKL